MCSVAMCKLTLLDWVECTMCAIWFDLIGWVSLSENETKIHQKKLRPQHHLCVCRNGSGRQWWPMLGCKESTRNPNVHQRGSKSISWSLLWPLIFLFFDHISLDPVKIWPYDFLGWLWVGLVWIVRLDICLSKETLTFWPTLVDTVHNPSWAQSVWWDPTWVDF